MRSSIAIGLAGLICWALTACAAPRPKPVTQLAPSACTTTLDLSAAMALTGAEKTPVDVEMSDASPCLLSADGKTQRVRLFHLPPPGPDYRVVIESLLDGETLFAVEAVTLDADRNPVRTLGHERFVTRGDRLHAVLFMKPEHAGERYLLIRSSTSVVGQLSASTVNNYAKFSWITVAGAVLGGGPVFHAVEEDQSVTRAHNGRVRIQLERDAATAPR